MTSLYLRLQTGGGKLAIHPCREFRLVELARCRKNVARASVAFDGTGAALLRLPQKFNLAHNPSTAFQQCRHRFDRGEHRTGNHQHALNAEIAPALGALLCTYMVDSGWDEGEGIVGNAFAQRNSWVKSCAGKLAT